MATHETTLVTQTAPVIDWKAIIAGTIASVALFGLFSTFGSALGLTMTSANPYAGLSATTIGIVLAVWFGAIHIASFAAGGYVAGRMRTLSTSDQSEREFRDGMHGFLVWALGALVAGYIVATAVASVTRGASEVASQAVGGAAAAASSAAPSAASSPKGSSALQDLIGYAGDLLLRVGPETPAAGTPATPPAPARAGEQNAAQAAEIARILTVAVASDGLSSQDRQYLVRLVSSRTGLAQPEAERRVDETWTRLRALRAEAETRVREAAETTRKAGVLGAFLTAAISLAGLVAAVWAAGVGGQHQTETRYPLMFGRQRFW
jgi:hypothetical protein